MTRREQQLLATVLAGLNGEYGEQVRRFYSERLKLHARFRKLQVRGINVSVPKARLDRAHVLVISSSKETRPKRKR